MYSCSCSCSSSLPIESQQCRHSATADPNEVLQMKMSPLLLLCAAALVQGGSADKFMPAAGDEIKYGRAVGNCCPEILEDDDARSHVCQVTTELLSILSHSVVTWQTWERCHQRGSRSRLTAAR